MAVLLTLIGFMWKPSIKTQPIIGRFSRGLVASITYYTAHAKTAFTHKPYSSLIKTAAKVRKFPILTIHSLVVRESRSLTARLRKNAKEKLRNYALR